MNLGFELKKVHVFSYCRISALNVFVCFVDLQGKETPCNSVLDLFGLQCGDKISWAPLAFFALRNELLVSGSVGFSIVEKIFMILIFKSNIWVNLFRMESSSSLPHFHVYNTHYN